jgi:HTH-type transcriptional repressor of NAD biosynthesis genes
LEKDFTQQTSDCLKVVLYGPESSGKTTLVNRLADHFNTVSVPEFMRIYLQDKWDKSQTVCEKNDLIPIAKGQLNSENELAQVANKYLFCDTNLREIKVYSKAYYDDFCPKEILSAVNKHHYHLYLLTYIDTPWEADDLRDKPTEREAMFLKFKNELDINNCNYVLLQGSVEDRLKTAIKHCEAL